MFVISDDSSFETRVVIVERGRRKIDYKWVHGVCVVVGPFREKE